jgi:hypothetical protein
VAGALALAAGNDQPRQARVADLAKVIAAAKNLSVKQVTDFLAMKGFDANAPLTERLAADAFGALGVTNLRASQNRAITEDQLGTLRSLAALVQPRTFGASDTSSGDGREPGEVVNVGKKTRPKGQTPNSNADVNAFGSLRDDPR